MASTTLPATIQPALPLAGAWFLHSGIQFPVGGFARYYRRDTQQNAAPSTEITGYGISTLVYLYQLTGETAYLDAARHAGLFLLHTAWQPSLGAMPFEYYPDEPEKLSPAYFFDCGIIVRGLLRLSWATADEQFRRGAQQVACYMAAAFPAGGGLFHPILELPSQQPVPYGTRWSRLPGCYHLKAALGWRELATETGEAQYAALYEEALRASLATHTVFLPGDPEAAHVMDRLHAYCYFLEALLPRWEQSECAATLREGIERVSHYLHLIAPEFARSDVYAQLLRLRVYADALGVQPLDRAWASAEAARIAEFQVLDADPHTYGGFLFGRRDGAFTPFVNPVSTAFCLQALEMYQQHKAGEFSPDPIILI